MALHRGTGRPFPTGRFQVVPAAPDEQQQYAEKQQSDPLGLLKGRTHLLSIHHGLLHGEKRQRL